MGNTALDRAKQLEAEAKSIRRAERQFWSDVDSRKDEILQHWGISSGGKNVGHSKDTVSDEDEDELLFPDPI